MRPVFDAFTYGVLTVLIGFPSNMGCSYYYYLGFKLSMLTKLSFSFDLPTLVELVLFGC